MFNIEQNLKNLPDQPGVYLHKDKYGEVIYVGKAVSLRKRVRQYFRASGQRDLKTLALRQHIAEFEYIVTGTEMEALILENTLIKKHMPRFNVMLRDDKTYPYIKITAAEQWPRLQKTRILKSDGSKYFGPYADVGAVNHIIDLLNDIYSLKRCNAQTFPEGFRPCLNGFIGKCRKVCQGDADHAEYMRDIESIEGFLKGKDKEVISYLTTRMTEAAEALDYERAAKSRDYITAAKRVTERQRVDMLSAASIDIIIATPSKTVTLFFVRDGRLTGREIHHLDAAENETDKEIIRAFIIQYYTGQTMLPKEIILEKHIEGEPIISELLTKEAGHKVTITVPERGEKKALIKLAKNDIKETENLIKAKTESEKEKDKKLTSQLNVILGLDPRISAPRIEAYDISHTGGTDSVGAMVVFKGRSPEKSAYRRFRIKSETAGDDYAAMQEVIYRRLKRAKENSKGFETLPDIILIDGGEGQVSAVMEILTAMQVQLPIAGMKKDDRHRTRSLILPQMSSCAESQDPQAFAEISLKDKPELYHLVGQIQEEVHRFAIEYHRGRRSKRVAHSILEEIPGIGPKRRDALLLKFGSIEAIKKATAEELKEVPGMNEKSAKEVLAKLNPAQ